MGEDEAHVVELLEQKAKCINTIDDRWILEWASLTEKYFKLEKRIHIRLKTVALISQIFSKYHVICGEDIMNKIILPNFSDADQETDSVVRKPIVHLLFDIASICLSYKHCNAIIAIVRKILTKPFRQKNEDTDGLVYVIGNVDIIDSRLIISNLNKLFKTKLDRLPIDPAVNMFDMLVNYLNLSYRRPLQDPAPAEIPMIRRELFSLFLNLRCNKHGHLGVLSSKQTLNDITYSPFIICVKRPRTPEANHHLPSSPKPESPTQTNFPILTPGNQLTSATGHVGLNHHQIHQQPQHHHNQPSSCSHGQNIFVSNSHHPNCPIESRCVNLDAMFVGIIECINQETDLDVLKLVLEGLPGLLTNKCLVLTANDDRVNQLCVALSNLILPNKLARQNSRIDIVKCGLRCLTSLLTYRRLLDQKSIKIMLSAFEDSLKVSRHPVVPLFTTCLIELQDSSEMTKFVPVLLSRLSKFSPTINFGTSILEFLSYLILFPKLYENFSEDEYKFMFAIALPYTNPFRFSDYITCLAFRVIAMWYLNCRPNVRCAFVELVKKSLQSNVIQPFKENSAPLYSQTSSPITQTPPITYSCPANLSPVDQRRRSSSLNTENNFRHQQGGVFGFPSQQLSRQVNEELIETFADLLSRYTHGQYLAVAFKNRCTESLIDRSTSQTWLHGNSLVTVTAGRANNGWAEIMIRRPTGNTSWIGRLQNTVGAMKLFNHCAHTDSLNFGNDIISLFSTMSFSTECGSVDEVSDQTTPSALSSASSTISGSNMVQTPASLNLQQQNVAKYRETIPLPKDKKFDIALSNFDHITPYETHKIGVIYVAKNQVDSRAAILANKCGSPKYYDFLSHMGTCVILKDIDPEVYFIGGLDTKGDDGKYAYFWKGNVTQVIFHVATFMVTRENDPQCNNKNRHIGNDHVCIVYNDSQAQFKLSTIKGTGQFIVACIVVSPLDDDTNVVEVEVLPDLTSILGEIEPKVLSNLGASLYARQLAIHLNLAAKIYERRHCEGFFSKEPYVSNWVERLRCIKRIRQRLEESRRACANNNSIATRGSSTLK